MRDRSDSTATGCASAEWVAVLSWTSFLLALRCALLGPYLLLDTDLGWHLAYGQWILDHGSLPRTDEWSWFSFGAPYQLTQWGGEVLLALSAHGGGLGMNALIAGALGLLFTLVFAAIRPWIQDRGLAACVALVVPMTVWAAPVRPVVFAWTLAAWMLFHLCRLAQRSQIAWRHVLGLGLATVAWANVHGSFVVGVLIAVLGLAGLAWRSIETPQGRDAGDWRRLFAGAGLVVLASGATPYGFGGWAAAAKVAGLQTTHYFLEWRPTVLLSSLGLPLIPVMLALLVLCWRRAALRMLLGGSLVIGFGLAATRNVPMSSVLGAAFVALAVQGSRVDRPPREQKPASWAPALVGLALAMLAWWASASFQDPGAWERAQALRYPVAIAQNLPPSVRGRLFAAQEEGGFWIRQGSGLQPMMDGRADLHGDLAYAQSLQVLGAHPGWAALLQRWQLDAIVIKKDIPLASALRRHSDWALAQDEGGFQLWLPTSADQATRTASPANEDFDPMLLLRPAR